VHASLGHGEDPPGCVRGLRPSPVHDEPDGISVTRALSDAVFDRPSLAIGDPDHLNLEDHVLKRVREAGLDSEEVPLEPALEIGLRAGHEGRRQLRRVQCFVDDLARKVRLQQLV
jgi:hypothetical protein